MSRAFVLAADVGDELPLAVSLTSLSFHNPGEDILVLDGGLLPQAKAAIDSFVGTRNAITWLTMDDAALEGTQVAGPQRLPVAANYRILLPELAPGLARAVYLDADTVVTAPMTALFDVALGESLLGAVPDSGSPLAAGPSGPDWRQLGLAPDAPYFNSGLLVIPLDAWRAADVPARALSVLREKSPRWGDQDALNVATAGDWVKLHRRYNLQTGDVTGRTVSWALWPEDVEAAVEDPALVHFNGHIKPWHLGCDHPLRELWWEALDRTPWRHWRPHDPGRLQRLLQRATRLAKQELARS